MRLVALAVLCIAGVVFADARTDLDAAQKALEARIAAKASLLAPEQSVDVEAGLGKTAAGAIGFAAIEAIGYTFKWMVFSGGWYWQTTDQYTTFYYLTQDNRNTYGATLALYVDRIGTTPSEWADLVVSVAQSNNATFSSQKVLSTFAGQSAYYTSYTYTTTYTWKVESWTFQHSGQAYEYRLFTTLTDWNTYSSMYGIVKQGLFFPQSTVAKQVVTTEPVKPFLDYYAAPNGSITFNLPAHSNEIYIYDIKGKLIRSLVNTKVWDGKDALGISVSSGFYVSNIRSGGEQYRAKISKP